MLSKILFIDLDGRFVKWINHYFKDILWIEGKTMKVQDYKSKLNERVAYMSPMNDMGLMETSIDKVYNVEMFKFIQQDIKKNILKLVYYFNNHYIRKPMELNKVTCNLPVGSSLLMPIPETEHFIVCSPTIGPDICYKNSPKNCYYSFKAVLKVVLNYCDTFGNKIDTIIVPALGCGSMNIDPHVSAKYIFTAFFECLMGLDKDISIYSSPLHYIFLPQENIYNNNSKLKHNE